jgi:hypothetical protein
MTWKQTIEMCELLDSATVTGAKVAQAFRERGLVSVEVVEAVDETLADFGHCGIIPLAAYCSLEMRRNAQNLHSLRFGNDRSQC